MDLLFDPLSQNEATWQLLQPENWVTASLVLFQTNQNSHSDMEHYRSAKKETCRILLSNMNNQCGLICDKIIMGTQYNHIGEVLRVL